MENNFKYLKEKLLKNKEINFKNKIDAENFCKYCVDNNINCFIVREFITLNYVVRRCINV